MYGVWLAIAAVLVATALAGCSTLLTYPEHKTVEERLADLPTSDGWPVEAPVRIYWHERMIPFVEAESDADAAFAIGMLHAHLRLGQMEMFRRLSAGRLAESGGPIRLTGFDRLIRTLDLERSARATYEALGDRDRQWLEHFVRGINYFVEHADRLPPEFRFLNLRAEPWTPVDALRLGRLGGGDPNWTTLLGFLSLTDEPGWEDVWRTYIESGKRSLPSFASDDRLSLDRIVGGVARPGSNSVVVGGAKAAGSGALIASDPHLGIFVPNLWLLMGYRTPEQHVLGYMLPGVPAVVFGRNRDVAWGGTSMRSISSHLVPVREADLLPPREERIKRRWWFDTTVPIRESTQGPIVNDVAGIDDEHGLIALSWTGHEPSNELGSLLAAARATNWTAFREAFADYAVSGLNVTYADREGNIGLLLAVRQPLLADASEQYALVKSAGNRVVGFRRPTELPSVYNPAKHYIASANNVPTLTEPAVAYVNGESERFERWTELLEAAPTVDAGLLGTWQNDVFSANGLALKEALTQRMTRDVPEKLADYWRRFRDWDGYYSTDSGGAVAFEMITLSLARSVLTERIDSRKLADRLLGSDDWRLFLRRELDAMSDAAVSERMLEALARTRAAADRYPEWGDFHVQPQQYPLGLIPVLGNRFRFGEYPAPGGTTTLNKSAFAPGFSKRRVIFGAQARHVSDMSTLDDNYFVMHGGNDGWLSNDRIVDQIPLWRAGEYLRIPMSREGVRRTFTRRQDIVPPTGR